MPTKASLPSALVEPTDLPPHSMDSSEKHSKVSSSRSKLSSHSSQNESGTTAGTGLFKSFKSFRRKKPPESGVNRRPSLIVTEADGNPDPSNNPAAAVHNNKPANLQLQIPPFSGGSTPVPPGSNSLIPPQPQSPTASVLKNPSTSGFLKGNLTPMLRRRPSAEFQFGDQQDAVTTPSSNNNSQKVYSYKIRHIM